jgi:hypothetical protein
LGKTKCRFVSGLHLDFGPILKSEAGTIKKGRSGTIERREWKLWSALATRSQLPRLAAFGDYGVASPEWLRGFDPEIMDPAAKIVYARDQDLESEGPFAPIFRGLDDPKQPVDWLGNPGEDEEAT